MKKLMCLLIGCVVLSSHDMFLKMDTFFLQPNTPATIKLFNGTFELSENAIARIRMTDISLVGNGARIHPDTSLWTENGHTTILNFRTGKAGTWVAGVSTKPNTIDLSAKDFNEYLEHDGVIDMLAWRKQNNALEKDASEKYSKHVKTIFQVGDQLTNDWQTVLEYPIEFVPMSNPYSLKPGDQLQVKLLRNGQPLPNQLVYVGSAKNEQGHSHADGEDHDHDHAAAGHTHGATQLTTDTQGILTMDLPTAGHWYLRTIHMEHLEEANLTHESNWATLTFEMRQAQNLTASNQDEHDHGGAHGHSHGPDGDHQHVPSYAYVLGVLGLLIGLYFFLRSKKS